jgi:hypothetical protein
MRIPISLRQRRQFVLQDASCTSLAGPVDLASCDEHPCRYRCYLSYVNGRTPGFVKSPQFSRTRYARATRRANARDSRSNAARRSPISALSLPRFACHYL